MFITKQGFSDVSPSLRNIYKLSTVLKSQTSNFWLWRTIVTAFQTHLQSAFFFLTTTVTRHPTGNHHRIIEFRCTAPFHTKRIQRQSYLLQDLSTDSSSSSSSSRPNNAASSRSCTWKQTVGGLWQQVVEGLLLELGARPPIVVGECQDSK